MYSNLNAQLFRKYLNNAGVKYFLSLWISVGLSGPFRLDCVSGQAGLQVMGIGAAIWCWVLSAFF